HDGAIRCAPCACWLPSDPNHGGAGVPCRVWGNGAALGQPDDAWSEHMTSNVGCYGAFAATDRGQPIQTFGSAEPVAFFDPRPGDVDLEVFAHALSLQCRFGGHCKVFYSVAQHCVLTARILHDSYWRHEALMHDAAEAYIGDVVRPLKMHLD